MNLYTKDEVNYYMQEAYTIGQQDFIEYIDEAYEYDNAFDEDYEDDSIFDRVMQETSQRHEILKHGAGEALVRQVIRNGSKAGARRGFDIKELNDWQRGKEVSPSFKRKLKEVESDYEKNPKENSRIDRNVNKSTMSMISKFGRYGALTKKEMNDLLTKNLKLTPEDIKKIDKKQVNKSSGRDYARYAAYDIAHN